MIVTIDSITFNTDIFAYIRGLSDGRTEIAFTNGESFNIRIPFYKANESLINQVFNKGEKENDKSDGKRKN